MKNFKFNIWLILTILMSLQSCHTYRHYKVTCNEDKYGYTTITDDELYKNGFTCPNSGQKLFIDEDYREPYWDYEINHKKDLGRNK